MRTMKIFRETGNKQFLYEAQFIIRSKRRSINREKMKLGEQDNYLYLIRDEKAVRGILKPKRENGL